MILRWDIQTWIKLHKLELHLLRRDEHSGELQELQITVRRSQLYFDESSPRKEN